MDYQHILLEFDTKVREVITDEKEQDSLFEMLKKYQEMSDVKKLVLDLKKLINDPHKLEIYDFIRPLIRPQHQQQYDKLAPNAPGQRLRVIKLHRRGNESFGFAVRGGYEHGVGVFVSRVQPGSQADQKGLKLGDEIVRVNGFTIAQAIHEEVLNLIKGRDEIELKVTNIGMVPIKQSATDPVTWQYVEKNATVRSQTSVASTTSSSDDNLVKIFINLRGASSLGCTIISGPKQFPGIFIETIRPGSLGADYGLEVGDQLMEVNGKSFLNIKHKEAIVELKGSKELNFVIKKGAGLSLLTLKKGDGGSPVQARPVPKPDVEDLDSAEAVCDILDDGIYSQINKTKRDDDREKLRKQQEEEKIREQYRQHELRRQMEEEERELAAKDRQEEEDRLREEAELHRRQVETQKRELEELKKQQEAKDREEKRKKEELDRKKREEERKRKEEEKLRQEVMSRKQQSAVLAGRSGPSSSMKPTLLGAAPGASTSFGKSKKTVKDVKVKLEENMSLDIELEGGSDSPLGGKIVVSEVMHGGAIYNNGEIGVGDTILKVNDKSFDSVTLSEANEMLWKAEQGTKPGGYVKFVIVESDLPKQDEITFF